MTHELELVCTDCFEDCGIITFIERNKVPGQCSFCGTPSTESSVALFADVVEHIRISLLQEYDNAGEWLFYESREGGFIGENWDTYEYCSR